MARHIPQEQLAAVSEVLAKVHGGLTLDEISVELQGLIPRRTLHRRLVLLVKRGQLRVRGKGRATRYSATATQQVHVDQGETTRELTYPRIGKKAAAVRRYVDQPLQKRKPVGYHREFLDAYVPNSTWYLSKKNRARLFSIGATEDSGMIAGTYARQIAQRLLIDLSWNSSRLEGNTYSILETERLLAFGEVVEGKAAFEAQMILNHKAAIEFLVESAVDIDINKHTLLNLHALLADNLLEHSAIGRLRRIPVGIGRTVYEPLQVPQLIEECFEQVLATARAISDPFEQCFFLMVHVPYLQPFEDVNKRVSRLAANIPLMRGNLRPLSFVDLPQQAYVDGILGIYELNRIELFRDMFVWAYERSAARYSAVRRSLGDPDPFKLKYRQQRFVVVGEIVRQGLNRQSATRYAKKYVVHAVAAEDRYRFLTMVKEELSHLHEGNIGRYQIRPSQFRAWRARW